jgi:hypothetical protein
MMIIYVPSNIYAIKWGVLQVNIKNKNIMKTWMASRIPLKEAPRGRNFLRLHYPEYTSTSQSVLRQIKLIIFVKILRG